MAGRGSVDAARTLLISRLDVEKPGAETRDVQEARPLLRELA